MSLNTNYTYDIMIERLGDACGVSSKATNKFLEFRREDSAIQLAVFSALVDTEIANAENRIALEQTKLNKLKELKADISNEN